MTPLEPVKTLEEIIRGLAEDFPEKSLYPYKNHDGNLMGVHGNHFIKRLNKVCGIGNWDFVYEVKQMPGAFEYGYRPAIVQGHLEIAHKIGDKILIHKTPNQFGGNANEDEGDALKGAVTDCMVKCSQFLEMLGQVFEKEPAIMHNSKDIENKLLNKIKGKNA